MLDIKTLRDNYRKDLQGKAEELPNPYHFYAKGWFTGVLNALHEVSPHCVETVEEVEYWHQEGLKGIEQERILQSSAVE